MEPKKKPDLKASEAAAMLWYRLERLLDDPTNRKKRKKVRNLLADLQEGLIDIEQDLTLLMDERNRG